MTTNKIDFNAFINTCGYQTANNLRSYPLAQYLYDVLVEDGGYCTAKSLRARAESDDPLGAANDAYLHYWRDFYTSQKIAAMLGKLAVMGLVEKKKALLDTPLEIPTGDYGMEVEVTLPSGYTTTIYDPYAQKKIIVTTQNVYRAL